jgi:hypothetical protein
VTESAKEMITIIGAGTFGALIGWYLYYVNRQRKSDVQLGDLTTVLGIVGGGAVTALFEAKSVMFGAYGIGLAVGFFSYLIVLIYMVARSDNFDADWFLDGRRKSPAPPYAYAEDGRPGPLSNFSASIEPLTLPIKIVPVVTQQGPAALDIVATARDVIDTCEAVWEANKADCNAFAKAVARKYNVTLSGQANDIVDQIRGSGWEKITSGPKAAEAAAAGKLVIGALKGSDMTPPEAHGHVVVVVQGPLAHGKYPSAYWGKLGGVGEKNKTINYAWKASDRDKVIFGARSI